MTDFAWPGHTASTDVALAWPLHLALAPHAAAQTATALPGLKSVAPVPSGIPARPDLYAASGRAAAVAAGRW